jgi:hypothetical protein
MYSGVVFEYKTGYLDNLLDRVLQYVDKLIPFPRTVYYLIYCETFSKPNYSVSLKAALRLVVFRMIITITSIIYLNSINCLALVLQAPSVYRERN